MEKGVMFMNVSDALSTEQERQKYIRLNNRTWFLMQPGLVGVCADTPTQQYIDCVLRKGLGKEGIQEINFVPLDNPTCYHKNGQFISRVQSILGLGNIDGGKLHTFIVSDQAAALAEELGLTVEANPHAIRQGNNKMNIIHVLQMNKDLSDHIKYGESFSLKKGVDSFVAACKHIGGKSEYVWVKMPESVAGNGVFKFNPQDESGIRNFWTTRLGSDGPIEGIPDGSLLIQQHIPHLVGFYNVMTKTDEHGEVSIVGSGITRQILNGESHIGNNQLLDNTISGEFHQLPEEIGRQMISLAQLVSKTYYNQLGSTGYSGIDFGVAYENGIYKVRIMEVNDRINGCYSLHHAYDLLGSSEGKKRILTSMNIPLGVAFENNQQKVDDKLMGGNDHLITKSALIDLASGSSKILPISFSGNTVQVLIATGTEGLNTPNIITAQNDMRTRLIKLFK